MPKSRMAANKSPLSKFLSNPTIKCYCNRLRVCINCKRWNKLHVCLNSTCWAILTKTKPYICAQLPICISTNPIMPLVNSWKYRWITVTSQMRCFWPQWLTIKFKICRKASRWSMNVFRWMKTFCRDIVIGESYICIRVFI